MLNEILIEQCLNFRLVTYLPLDLSKWLVVTKCKKFSLTSFLSTFALFVCQNEEDTFISRTKKFLVFPSFQLFNQFSCINSSFFMRVGFLFEGKRGIYYFVVHHEHNVWNPCFPTASHGLLKVISISGHFVQISPSCCGNNFFWIWKMREQFCEAEITFGMHIQRKKDLLCSKAIWLSFESSAVIKDDF